MAADLVLSLFPGIGMLDSAFESEGFCVVRGPDILWGGDIRRFHPPAGTFDGVIGGPPCQAHSSFAAINAERGNRIAEDLVPEFARCILEAGPRWWLMENVPAVPDLKLPGFGVSRRLVDNRWFGMEQRRVRCFQFGAQGFPPRLDIGGSLAVLEASKVEATCLAKEGSAGRLTNKRVNGKQQTKYHPRRDWGRFCELQGLPAEFLEDAPFTNEARYRVVGNGVPIAMGRAIARAVKLAIADAEKAVRR